MSRPLPPDYKERKQALDPSQSFIVQAPAGSGKTSLLIRRYLVLLAQVNRPEEILAITFTRKATSEMRDRMHAILTQAAHDPQSINDEEVRTLAKAVIARDEKQQWHLSRNTQRLKIMTIDAFCAEIVRRMPWTSGLGGMPSMVENEQAFYLQAAQQTLQHIEYNDQWSDACRRLLTLAKGNWQKAQQLLAQMLGSRDLWMRDVALERRDAVQAAWHELILADIRRAESIIDNNLKEEIVELFNFARSEINKNQHELLTPLMALVNIAPLSCFPQCRIEALEEWQAIAAFLTTDSGWRKKLDKNMGLATDKKAQKEQLQGLLAVLSSNSTNAAELRALKTLPPAWLDDDTWNQMQSLYELLFVCAAQLRVIYQQKHQSDFTEIAQRAHYALGELEQPSDLALSMDYQIKHVLMDEFQDTSTAQVEFLTKLTQGFSDEDNRSLFIVGDPMQSIYRFRGAEVSNFIKVREQGIANKKLNSLTLRSNFRCQSDLIHWFNQQFSNIFPSTDDMQNGAISYSYASVPENNIDDLTPAVQCHALLEDETNEAHYISNLVAQLQQHTDKTIAILGRNKSHLAPIAEALDIAGIAHADTELQSLQSRSEIRDLLALTRAILHRADRIAWLALLRAPWCGLTVDELYAVTRIKPNACIPDCLMDPQLKTKIKADTYSRVQWLLDALAPAITQKSFIELHELIEACWLRLGAPRYLSALQLNNARDYFALLMQIEQQGLIEYDQLMQRIEKLWPATTPVKSVQLMTIHKAKGLEFDTVILAGMNRSNRSGDKPVLTSLRMPQQLLLAPLLHNPHAPANGFYRYIQDINQRKEHFELMRLLYVACTRAKSQLNLVATLKRKKEGIASPLQNTLLHLLWPVLEEDFTNNLISDNIVTTEPLKEPFNKLSRISMPASPPVLPETIEHNTRSNSTDTDDIEFSWAGEVARLAGVAVHRLLQYIDIIGWSAWQQKPQNYFKSQLHSIAIDTNLNHTERAQYETIIFKAIDNIKADNKAKFIFSPMHSERMSEWELTYAHKGKIRNIIIDRSFIDQDGTRWIIDFKTSRHEGSDVQDFINQEKIRYHNQLENYALAVSSIESRPIMLALYFPLLNEWINWPYQQ